MKKVLSLINSKILPILLAAVILFNVTTDAVAQVRTFNPKREYNRPYTAVADNTRVVIPSAQVQKINQRGFDASKKIQAIYDKKQADDARATNNLKTTYKYTEFDKTGYLTQGQWSGKRKDGSVKNTGFFGEIVIQGGKYRGKVITEASVMIKKNGKEIEVPLLNPYLSPRDIEVLRYGNINANIIKSADFWLQQRQMQGLSPFAQGKEIAEKSKWAYNDVTNMLQVSFLEVQKQKERKAAIAARIKKGEKNPYFFGKDCDEWNQVAAEMQKQADVEQRANAVMASNKLFTKEDAVKQVNIADEEYAKNEKRITRETRDSIREKINAAQRAAAIKYKGQQLNPKAMDKYISIADAVSFGFISKEEAEEIHHQVANKYIGKAVQNRFEQYVQNESGHNTANLGAWGSVKARFNYFWTHVQNNSIIGKASIWLYAGGEGLVTMKDPSKIYQREYQRNQQYLNYYNMGTKWSFVDDIALTAGTFGSDAGVFKAIGLASGAVLPRITAASSTAAKIILPSVQTGLVLGTYDGLNTLGDALGYKDFGKLNSNDWGKIAYNTGRGFTSGVIVGQYGRMIWGNQAVQKTLIAKPLSQQLANGARNVGLGMSEGAVFSVAGAGYDQVNSTWLPAQGTPNYIGGNSKAFAQMTPTSLLKDMVKFYFAIKLPGNVMFGAESNGGKVNTKKTAPVRKSTVIPETNSTVKPEVKTVTTKEAVSEDVTPIKKGTYVIEESAPGVAEVKFKWMLENEPVQTLNKSKTLTQQVGEGSGGSAEPVKTTQELKAKTAPVYEGYKAPEGTPIKTYQPKPMKFVEDARVKKAFFRANVDQTISIFNQIARSARTRFGAIMLSTALSLSNPIMLNAAESGKVMPMVEMLAGTESVGSFKGLRTTRRQSAAASVTTEVKAATEEVKAPQDITYETEAAKETSNEVKPEVIKPEIVQPEIVQPAAIKEKPQMTVWVNDKAPLRANKLYFSPVLVNTSANEKKTPFETYYDAERNSYTYWDTDEAAASLKEEQAIATAWDRVKKDPLKGKADDVLVTLKAGSRIFEINHGAATMNSKTKEVIVSGPVLKRARGTHDNFGLTKIIFKHGESREVMPVSGVKKSDLMKLPYILRNYTPIQSESSDKKLVYRIPAERGTLFVAFSKMSNGRYMFITMFYEENDPSKNLEFSSRRDEVKKVSPSKTFYLAKPDFMPLKQAVHSSPKQQVPLLAAENLPLGWKLETQYDVKKYTALAHTSTELRVAPTPQVGITSNISSDPMILSSFVLLPLIMKIRGIKPLHKQAKDQHYQNSPSSAEDLLGNIEKSSDNPLFAEDGFFLTYEDSQTPGKEELLPVDLDIDNSFKTKGYNRVFLNKNGIAELRNNNKAPKPMSGFYMKLNGYTQDFADFITVANTAELNGNLKIKLLQVGRRTPKNLAAVKLYTDELTPLPVEVELDASLMRESDTLVMLDTGELAILASGEKQAEVIEDYYIRLPKNQINNLVSILKVSPRRFGIQIASTKDKAGVVIKEVSMTSVSLGKTFAPVVGPTLGMSEADANSLMFGINYLLPGLSSFFNPVLKRFGEKNLLMTSLYLSAAAGIIATASGFYGFVDSMPHSLWRTGAFVTAVGFMAVSGILKQLVCNMLIKANRGDVAATTMSSSSKITKKGTPQLSKATQKVTFKDVVRRTKEVFTKKSHLSLQDAFFYNLSFMFKNFGTLLFLALPYAVNWSIKLATGIDLGLDYSFSFPIFAAFSIYTLIKTYKAHLRDPYSKKPTAKESIAAAAKEADMSVEDYKKQLLKQQKAKEDIKLMSTAGETLAESQKNKEDGVINVFKNNKAVIAVTIAMTLATVHEFVLSSSFASILKQLFQDGSASNFMVAACLYIPLLFGRVLGNVAGQRMSSSSLYIIGSALSAIGTGIVMMGIGSPAAVMTGASIASMGIGNFFTQMYNYLTAKYPKHNREISVILSVTMALASIVSLPARYLAEGTGIQNISVAYAMLALIGSLILTNSMMKDSTMYKFIAQMLGSYKPSEFKGKTPSDAKTKLPGKLIEKEQRPIPPTDTNNPLPN